MKIGSFTELFSFSVFVEFLWNTTKKTVWRRISRSFHIITSFQCDDYMITECFFHRWKIVYSLIHLLCMLDVKKVCSPLFWAAIEHVNINTNNALKRNDFTQFWISLNVDVYPGFSLYDSVSFYSDKITSEENRWRTFYCVVTWLTCDTIWFKKGLAGSWRKCFSVSFRHPSIHHIGWMNESYLRYSFHMCAVPSSEFRVFSILLFIANQMFWLRFQSRSSLLSKQQSCSLHVCLDYRCLLAWTLFTEIFQI